MLCACPFFFFPYLFLLEARRAKRSSRGYKLLPKSPRARGVWRAAMRRASTLHIHEAGGSPVALDCKSVARRAKRDERYPSMAAAAMPARSATHIGAPASTEQATRGVSRAMGWGGWGTRASCGGGCAPPRRHQSCPPSPPSGRQRGAAVPTAASTAWEWLAADSMLRAHPCACALAPARALVS